jgi:hypothetical protein
MKKILFFLWLLILQGVVISLAMIAVSLIVFLVPATSTDSSPLSIVAALLLGALIVFAILIISAIWTYRDARKFIRRGANIWMPVGWALIAFFFWFPGFAIYLYLRKFRYKAELQRQIFNVVPGNYTNTARILLGVGKTYVSLLSLRVAGRRISKRIRGYFEKIYHYSVR